MYLFIKTKKKMSIFRVDDKVYNHHYGWLTISEASGYFCHCLDENGNLVIVQPIDLSFTEYTLTGFSQGDLYNSPKLGRCVCLAMMNAFGILVNSMRKERLTTCSTLKAVEVSNIVKELNFYERTKFKSIRNISKKNQRNSKKIDRKN